MVTSYIIRTTDESTHNYNITFESTPVCIYLKYYFLISLIYNVYSGGTKSGYSAALVHVTQMRGQTPKGTRQR